MRKTHFLLCALVAFQAAACVAEAAPEWRHTAHHERKLYADVLLGDERGTYWNDRLPEGWVWLKEPKAPGADYYSLDQVEPKVQDGKVVFLISKWNFFEINRQHAFTLEQLAAKAKEIDASADVQFRESDESKAILLRFSATDLKEAEKLLLEGAKDELLPKFAEKSLFVVKAKSGTIAVVLFERLSSTAVIRVRVLRPSAGGGGDGGGGAPPAERREARATDAAWSVDLDDHDRAQVEWVPRSATADAYLRPADGVVLAPAGSAK